MEQQATLGGVDKMLVQIADETMRLLLEGVGSETRKLEFKESYPWKARLSDLTVIQARTIKTILAMSNNRGGGKIVIGVKETGSSNLELEGVSDNHLETYQDTEAMARLIDRISSGHVDFTVGAGNYSDKTFIVITVNVFARLPNFARIDVRTQGEFVIRKDDLYVRANSAVPQTIKMTPEEFQDIVRIMEERDEEFIGRLIQSGARQMSDDTGVEYTRLDRDLE